MTNVLLLACNKLVTIVVITFNYCEKAGYLDPGLCNTVNNAVYILLVTIVR